MTTKFHAIITWGNTKIKIAHFIFLKCAIVFCLYNKLFLKVSPSRGERYAGGMSNIVLQPLCPSL